MDTVKDNLTSTEIKKLEKMNDSIFKKINLTNEPRPAINISNERAI
jgi:hypothetical protein